MQLATSLLEIPPQIWAVLRALSDNFHLGGLEGYGVDEDAVIVRSRAYYAKRGRAPGFVLSYSYPKLGTLNLTVTEHGGADCICVIPWLTADPALDPAERPDSAPCACFENRDVLHASDYVLELVECFLAGRGISELKPKGAIAAE